MRRGVWLFLVFLFLLSLGCVAPNTSHLPCCDREKVISDGTCVLKQTTSSTSPYVSDYCDGCHLFYCAYADVEHHDGEDEVVYKVHWNSGEKAGETEELNCQGLSAADFNNKTHPCNNIGYCVYVKEGKSVAFPICSGRSRYRCENGNCTSMFCGSLRYAPRRSFLPHIGYDVALQPMDAGVATNLYKASCIFMQLSHENIQKLERAANFFQNSFRFGIGKDINDFEEARWYFPVSDYFSSLLVAATGGKTSFSPPHIPSLPSSSFF